MKRHSPPTRFSASDCSTCWTRCFPGVRQTAKNAAALGASWESASTPFLCFEQGRAVSHVGVIELSLVLLGHIARVGAVHGVATHPDFRRRVVRRIRARLDARISFGTAI
jgi:hypothetical protein